MITKYFKSKYESVRDSLFFTSLRSAVLFIMVITGTTIGAEPEVLIERIEKIHSDGQWNGRAGIVF